MNISKYSSYGGVISLHYIGAHCSPQPRSRLFRKSLHVATRHAYFFPCHAMLLAAFTLIYSSDGREQQHKHVREAV